MSAMSHAEFQQPDLLAALESLDDPALDQLDFGVIGFDAQTCVRRYNQFEARASGLQPQRVLGHDLFGVVAQCMNNFLVAQRFEDAHESGAALDETIDYVLTWRMRPCKVKLRMLADPAVPLRYVLLKRV